MIPSQPAYYKPLTGLRFVAALMVFFSHFTTAVLPPSLYNFVAEFQTGVPIFFVLSGYLICSRYYDNVSFDKHWLKKYFVNRFARIYPMFFLITLLNVLYKQEGIKIFLLNITFLKGFFESFVYTGTPPGWSITTEECFYFLAPLIFLLVRKGVPVILQVLFCLSFGLLLVFVFIHNPFYGFFGSFDFMMVYTFFGRCFEFFTGVYLALYLRRKNFVQKTGSINTLTGISGIILCIVMLSLIRQGAVFAEYGNLWVVIHNFLLPVPIAILLIGLIYESTFVSKILSTGFMQLLGKSSYSFYLIHFGVFHWLFFAYAPQNLFLLLFTITLLSILLYKTIEEPANYYLRKVF
jgi:peptidoglycan/LPS O-acetylase OafA/YrhL